MPKESSVGGGLPPDHALLLLDQRSRGVNEDVGGNLSDSRAYWEMMEPCGLRGLTYYEPKKGGSTQAG